MLLNDTVEIQSVKNRQKALIFQQIKRKWGEWREETHRLKREITKSNVYTFFGS